MGSEQETEVTDATVEQQGETKRRREYPEVPQAADSSCSSSSESSTDIEMVVDVCVRFSVTIPMHKIDVKVVR